MAESEAKASRTERIEEYKLTQEFVLHHERLIWYIGSILSSAVILFSGLLFQASGYRHLWVGVLASCGASLYWWLFARRQRQINRLKLKRIHELEESLHFFQSRYVVAHDVEAKPYFTAHRIVCHICLAVPALVILLMVAALLSGRGGPAGGP